MAEERGSAAGGPVLAMTEIRVVDWEGTLRWYEETLGLHTVLLDDHHQFALLAAGASRLALKGIGPQPPGTPTRGADGVRLVFRVDDVDAEFARLRGLGIEVSEPADHPRERYREVRLADNEGNPITLFQWRGDPPAAGAPMTA